MFFLPEYGQKKTYFLSKQGCFNQETIISGEKKLFTVILHFFCSLISQKYYTEIFFLFNAKILQFKNYIFGYEVQYLFLFKQYPLVEDFKGLSNGTSNDVVHMYFSSQRSRNAEWVPFLITILMVFLYVYFSIKRIEFVKSKFGIALTAIATVICATCMSLGLSGISLNLNSKISLGSILI